jgi:hypothetical protein
MHVFRPQFGGVYHLAYVVKRHVVYHVTLQVRSLRPGVSFCVDYFDGFGGGFGVAASFCCIGRHGFYIVFDLEGKSID